MYGQDTYEAADDAYNDICERIPVKDITDLGFIETDVCPICGDPTDHEGICATCNDDADANLSFIEARVEQEFSGGCYDN